MATEAAEIDSSDVDHGKLGAFVRARIGLIKACYENQLKRNPTLKGKIRIHFTILETGGLTDVAVIENTLGAPEVASCILGTMRGLAHALPALRHRDDGVSLRLLGPVSVNALRLSELRDLLQGPAFAAWWAEFGRVEAALPEARTRRDDLQAQLQMIGARTDAAQESAAETLARAGEVQDRCGSASR